jgi:hypothetical protein
VRWRAFRLRWRRALMCQAPVVMRASALVSYATQSYCAPRERESLWPLIRVFEIRPGPTEVSLAGHDHASSSLREHGRDTRHPAALASGGSNADQNKRRGGVGTPSSGCACRVGCLSDASRTLAVIEPASQHGGLPNLAKP